MAKYKLTSEIGKFYIGDPCYVSSEAKNFYDVWSEHGYENGCYLCPEEFSPTKSPAFFAAHGTAYGDGSYESNSGKLYGVDSGTLGCVPFELIPEDKREGADSCGRVVSGHTMELEVDQGVFVYTLDGHNIETIYTSDNDDSEDEDYYGEDEEE